jgi:hypothetical protein
VGYRGTKRDQQESVHTYILHVNTVLLLLLLFLSDCYITSGGISIGTNGACNNNASWKFEDALDAPFIKMDRDLEFALAALQQQRLLEV